LTARCEHRSISALYVGWVERSDTHRPSVHAIDGFRFRSTHPAHCTHRFQSGYMAHHRHVLRSQKRFERLSKMELT
jgi:hypothetical protein